MTLAAPVWCFLPMVPSGSHRQKFTRRQPMAPKLSTGLRFIAVLIFGKLDSLLRNMREMMSLSHHNLWRIKNTGLFLEDREATSFCHKTKRRRICLGDRLLQARQNTGAVKQLLITNGSVPLQTGGKTLFKVYLIQQSSAWPIGWAWTVNFLPLSVNPAWKIFWVKGFI